MILTETIAAAAAADVEEDMVNRIKERSVMNTTIYNVELSTTRNGVDEMISHRGTVLLFEELHPKRSCFSRCYCTASSRNRIHFDLLRQTDRQQPHVTSTTGA